MPTTLDAYQYISGRNGSYLFDDSLADRFIEINLGMMDIKSLSDTRQKAREIAAWLYTKQREQLIFSDEPDKFYLAKVEGVVDLERFVISGTVTIVFRCLPLAYSVVESSDDITLDSDLTLYSDILLGSSASVFNITESTTVQVDNFGTKQVKPIIELDGTFTDIAITINGKTLNYNEPITSELLVIDTERMTARIGTANKLNDITGDFLSIDKGLQDVAIAGTALNVDLKIKFRPEFL